MITQVKVKIKKFNHFVNTSQGALKYATQGSSGFDLAASISENIPLKPMQRMVIPTGVAIAIMEPGYEAQVRSRSGLASKNGVVTLNSPGTIDNDYRGEIKVILMNFGQEEFIVTPGMRIAQLVISKYSQANFEEVDCLESESTDRGDSGFGSTGT